MSTMKFTCTQPNLERGLSIVGRAVPTRSTLPITSHVLLATDGGRLKLAATDLAIALTCWVDALVEEEGALAVPARLVSEFVSSLPSESISGSMAPRGRQLTLTCARNVATVSGMDAEEFPPIPAVAGGATLHFQPESLRQAIQQVVFAAATDDSRPVLTGVHILIEGSEATLAATDGFRLAVHTLALSTAVSERIEMVVPAKALAELGRLLADQEEPVEMALNEARTQVLFRMPAVQMVAQLVQGTFPSYSQLIPQEHTSRAVVDVGDFLRETRIASIFARDGSGIVRLQAQPGEGDAPGRLSVSARAEELGDHHGELDATVERGEAKIAFNSRYLIDVLSNLPPGQVALETTSPSSPGVFRPVGTDNYVHVVMPMFVQW